MNSDQFGTLNDDDLTAELIHNLPELLRRRTCPAGEPWTGDNPDADHGHTDCYFMRLAASEIERLREAPS